MSSQPGPHTASSTDGAQRGVTTHAFGLGLDLRFEVPGLEDAATTRPRLRLGLVPSSKIEEAWAREESEPLVGARRADGALAMTIDRSGDDHRVWAEGYGLYLLSPSRRCIECAPPADVPSWRWQRLLIGHVLPLAAVLAGLEVLHASAVAIDDRVVAFVGRTGAGKTSLAVNLVLGGAGFVCDDVLALEAVAGGPVLAHPGPGLCNLQRSEAGRLADQGVAARLQPIGEDEESLRIMLAREPEALPLDRLYFVDRSREAVQSLEIEQTHDPGVVLGATFNLLVRSAQRLTRQLDLGARVAADTKLFRLRIPPTLGAAAAAEVIAAHVRTGS